MDDISLDEAIAKDRNQRNKKPNNNNNNNNNSNNNRNKQERGKGKGSDDDDESMDIDSRRSSSGPVRRHQNRNKNGSGKRETPYHRPAGKLSKYNTTGDVERAWKHDLFDKKDDEVEQTGWGTRRKQIDVDDNVSAVATVDNLHYEVTEAELKAAFSEKCKSVLSAKIEYDATGRSLGEAEISFAEQDDGDNALTLNGANLKGQNIRVKLKIIPPKQARHHSSRRDDRETFGSLKRDSNDGDRDRGRNSSGRRGSSNNRGGNRDRDSDNGRRNRDRDDDRDRDRDSRRPQRGGGNRNSDRRDRDRDVTFSVSTGGRGTRYSNK